MLHNDYHIHTGLSSCSNDPEMNPTNIIARARTLGHGAICLSDHCWDDRVPGSSGWYAPQTVEHVSAWLPLPETEDIEVYFGCETEYVGGRTLALSPEGFKVMDHVNIPVSHFHMYGLVRPEGVITPEQYARLLEERIAKLTELDIPFDKTGVVHVSSTMTKDDEHWRATMELLDADALYASFKRCAALGVAIELNASCFPEGWREDSDLRLKMYRIARDAGCLFYLGTDAHHLDALDRFECLTEVFEALELDESRQYIVRPRGIRG